MGIPRRRLQVEVFGERRAERHLEAVVELRPDLLALFRVEVRIEVDVSNRLLQVVLGV
jgi:septum formation topological specificity factor MinE